MNQKITKNEVKDILNIVLCISAKDGVLSDTEIEKSLEDALINKFTQKTIDDCSIILLSTKLFVSSP